MTEQLPVLIILAPLFGAILILMLGMKWRSSCAPIAIGAMILSLLAACDTFLEVLMRGEIRYALSGWERVNGSAIGIEYRVDAINGLVLVVIAVVALLNLVYSRTRIAIETPDKLPHIYILSLLLVAGLAGMTITNDAFNLYVLLEISSLTSYALVAMGSRRAALSAFNYVIMGTIGASFMLLGIGYLYIKTGTLNMLDIHAVIASGALEGSASITVAFMLIMIGVWIKMAFFPLHGWLPNAYAYSPTATGCLMAPLVTKVMVYIMIRMMLTVFGVSYVFETLNWSTAIVTLASIAIVAGSFFAISMGGLRKMLTYIIVAEVGYMVGGAWLANQSGMTGAIYHIISDALMTLCLFFVVGVVIARTGEQRLIAFKGLYRRMPLTMIAFTIGAFSMIGLPPTCGFFSKFYLVRGGIEAGQWQFVVALLISSLVNAVMFFRLIELAWFHKPDGEEEHDHDTSHAHAAVEAPSIPLDPDAEGGEAQETTPWSMVIPMLITAGLLLVIGLCNSPITGWIQHALTEMGLN